MRYWSQPVLLESLPSERHVRSAGRRLLVYLSSGSHRYTIHRAKLVSGATSRCACVQKRSTECWRWWAKWDLWCAIRVVTILVCSLYRFHSVFSPWIICDNDYFPQYVPHTVIFDFCLINLFFFPRDHFRLVHIPQGLLEQEAQLMLTYTRDARCAFHVK